MLGLFDARLMTHVNDTRPPLLLKKYVDISILDERPKLACDIVNQHFHESCSDIVEQFAYWVSV